ncbi:unnamed protein product [Auanema sp. JU1783]|nr:unnamed protein product [Auanema sp. JU1783]
MEDNPCEVEGATSNTSSPITESSESIGDDQAARFKNLYDKYSSQQKELERLEEQNAEYREKLLRTIRERDLNDELLRNVREETKKENDDLKKKLKDTEVQLKTLQDKTSVQETQFNNTIKDLSTKYNTSLSQMSKKADQAEKDKNEAVIKYATREAEIMKVRAEMQKKDQEVKEIAVEKEKLLKCQDQENVEQLEKTVNSLRVELEKIKNERFDLENRLKMSEKRLDASQTSINELKQHCEVLRKQLINTKEERSQLYNENRELSARSQLQENRLQQETESATKFQSDYELKFHDLNGEVVRLRSENHNLNNRMDSITKENLDLITKLQNLEDKLELEEENHTISKKEILRLSLFESQVKKNLEKAERCEKAQLSAEQDRDIAEKEAEECRLQAERMLQITEQLSQRNSQFASDTEREREKNHVLEQELVQIKGSLSRAESRILDLDKDLKEAQGSSDSENSRLKEELKLKIQQVQELTQKLTEEKNDSAAYKRKQTANVKELKQELSNLRKQLESGHSDSLLSASTSNSNLPSISSRSRASSITSLDRTTNCSQEEHPNSTVSQKSEEISTSMQQAMVDKIVQLQRKLARRTEKIEFLEEHVKQCLEELQKKTKIIQNYALREESSLLLPQDASLDQLFDICEIVQVPMLKKGTSYALMGSIFNTGEKRSLQLVTEVNSRLQAVLEDTLLKNITLKNSVESLGNEISRLSRENRVLLITQAKD